MPVLLCLVLHGGPVCEVPAVLNGVGLHSLSQTYDGRYAPVLVVLFHVGDRVSSSRILVQLTRHLALMSKAGANSKSRRRFRRSHVPRLVYLVVLEHISWNFASVWTARSRLWVKSDLQRRPGFASWKPEETLRGFENAQAPPRVCSSFWACIT